MAKTEEKGGNALNTRITVLRIIVFICFFASLSFIFGNSLLPKGESASVSGGVQGVIEAIVGEDSPIAEFFRQYLRKIAHVTEFALLAIEVTLLRFLYDKRSCSDFIHSLSFGLFVAVTDEALQIFSNRGPLVSDVLIDLSGYFVLAFVAEGLIILTLYVMKKRESRREISV